VDSIHNLLNRSQIKGLPVTRRVQLPGTALDKAQHPDRPDAGSDEPNTREAKIAPKETDESQENRCQIQRKLAVIDGTSILFR
jgi:hypothetical protein